MNDDVISLQDYLAVLRRQRWIVLSVTVLVVVAALTFSFLQTPVYEAETEVVVEPIRRSQDVTLEELLGDRRGGMETERVMMTSRPVAERAADELGVENVSGLRDRVSAQVIADTEVVRVSATDVDPSFAADIANAFAEAYLAHRRDQAVESLMAARSDLDERAAELRAQIAELDEQVEEEGQEDAPGPDDAALDDEIADVDPDATAATVEREVLLAQLAQLSAQAADLGEVADSIAGGGSILTPAEVPESPVSPQPVRTGALAVVLGLLLGVGLAFLRDHLDDVVRDETDFKRATGHLPVLGRIPTWEDPEGGQRLPTIIAPSAPVSEAYRELSAGVRFLLVAQDPSGEPELAGGHDQGRLGHSVLVASAAAGDGKSSTAANLAVAAARVGLRTLLVDTDLRRPTLAKRFGLGEPTGLSDVLLEGGRVSDHVLPVGVDDLLVLPAGTLPPNPHELLASPAMQRLARELVTQADLVVYDTPAVLAVPDALELGRHTDLTILVGRAGVTGRRQLSAAIERLEQVGTDVGGTVLNAIDPKGEGYYYGYYYVEEPVPQPEAEDRSRRRRRGAEKDAPAEPSSRVSVRSAPGDAGGPAAGTGGTPTRTERAGAPGAPHGGSVGVQASAAGTPEPGGSSTWYARGRTPVIDEPGPGLERSPWGGPADPGSPSEPWRATTGSPSEPWEPPEQRVDSPASDPEPSSPRPAEADDEEWLFRDVSRRRPD